MGQPGFGGALDTPRTNIGDATYLTQKPDFADISQEASFQSPGKDGNFLQQLRNGRSNGINLRTPRQRGPLADRRNLPASVGGAEFTPLLKSATRNSVRRHGKENGAAVPNTPAFLNAIDEDDMTPLPRMDASIYAGSRDRSYLDNTLPQVETSSVASTPMALPKRRTGGDQGPLNDGNQLSLREQENVIDRIEKENFGLKLKIHFLEDALRKAGPGFSEAALKENTELKVDKVTMQRELHQYKKNLTVAERDLETYRKEMMQLQEKAKRKYADENQRAEMEQLRKMMEEREADIENLQRQVDQAHKDQDQFDKLQDDLGDLEADVREKDGIITQREDELEELREQLDEAKRNHTDEDQQAEMEQLRKTLEEREADIEELQRQADQEHKDEDRVGKLQDDIGDLEADLRDKDRMVTECEDELEQLRKTLEEREVDIRELQRQADQAHSDQDQDQVNKLQDNIGDLEADLRERDRVIVEREDELEQLRTMLEELQRQVDHGHEDQDQVDKLQDDIGDLEADLREKDQLIIERDRMVIERDDELDELRDQLNNAMNGRDDEVELLKEKVEAAEDAVKDTRRKMLALEQDGQQNEDLEEAKDTIQDLEQTIRRLEEQVDDMKNKMEDAVAQRNRAEADLEELQEGMADKSVATKGLSRQIDEKVGRLQVELDKSSEEYAVLEKQLSQANRDNDALKEQVNGKVTRLQKELDKSSEEYAILEKQLSQVNQDSEALKDQVDEIKAKMEDAIAKKNRAETDLEEMQEEMADLAERAAAQATQDLHRQLSDLEDQKVVLEEVLEEARQQAEETGAQHDRALRRMKSKLDEAERNAAAGSAGDDEQTEYRRKSLAEIEDLEHDVRQQQERIQTLTASESSLRRKLEEAERKAVVAAATSSGGDKQARQLRRTQAETENLKHDIRHQQEMIEALTASEASLRRKLDEAERHAVVAAAATVGGDKQARQLRRTQAETENLKHDVLQQQEMLETLADSESSLRRKLERARSERSAYRMSAEKLQRDVQRLKQAASSASDLMDKRALVSYDSGEALDTVVRAADSAGDRHSKELRGMVMQMEWMQARWEREASLRADAGYAKKFLQLQLDIANACNKAQLRELESIRTNLLGSRKPLALPHPPKDSSKPTLKTFLNMARFIARARISARAWAKQEVVRRKLIVATEEQRRTKRARQLKVVRAEVC